MNLLERTFLNNPIRTAVNTLENENFGFKRIHFTRYEKGCTIELAKFENENSGFKKIYFTRDEKGCTIELTKYNKEFNKLQSIMIYAEENGIVTRVEYKAERV